MMAGEAVTFLNVDAGGFLNERNGLGDRLAFGGGVGGESNHHRGKKGTENSHP